MIKNKLFTLLKISIWNNVIRIKFNTGTEPLIWTDTKWTKIYDEIKF